MELIRPLKDVLGGSSHRDLSDTLSHSTPLPYHPSSIIHHPSSIIHHPSSIIHHQALSEIWNQSFVNVAVASIEYGWSHGPLQVSLVSVIEHKGWNFTVH
jgi:hypothetical protein